jgi:hypothetical protein
MPGPEKQGLQKETVSDLWAHARELCELGEVELAPPAVRRALVTLAVAGSGGDPHAFRVEVERVHAAARKCALDSVALFDAASALLAEDDQAAREAFVTVPRNLRPPG